MIAYLTGQRYDRELRAVSPEALRSAPHSGKIRVEGWVEAGTLSVNPEKKTAGFILSGTKERFPVDYRGDDLDSLRELKFIVISGKWNSGAGRFEAGKISLVSNYGYIMAAYLAGFFSLAFYLFNMERKVALLTRAIKKEKLYQPDDIV